MLRRPTSEGVDWWEVRAKGLRNQLARIGGVLVGSESRTREAQKGLARTGSMNLNWRGVFPAATTQFTTDQSLDIDATMRHLDAMIEAGVHGMIMLGTVGENCSLEYAEKLDVLQGDGRARRRPRAGADGVAEYTTRSACRFAEAAAEGSASTA